MERNDCKLAQDLMPLYIDDICSEESKAFVAGHIASCPGCAQVYGHMQATLLYERREREKEGQSLKAAMTQFKKTMAWRRLRGILLGMLASLLVFATLTALTTISTALPLDKYDISLKQTQAGKLLTIWHFLDKGRIGSSSTMTGETDEDGNYIMYLYSQAPLLNIGRYQGPSTQYDLNSGLIVKDGKLYTENTGLAPIHAGTEATGTPVHEVRQGNKDKYRVLYKAGDTLPVATEKEAGSAIDLDQYVPIATPGQELPFALATPPADK